jgi:hypothetical protein
MHFVPPLFSCSRLSTVVSQSLVSAAPTQQPPVFVGGRLFFSIAEYPIYYSKLILQCQDFFREHRTAGNRFFAQFL